MRIRPTGVHGRMMEKIIHWAFYILSFLGIISIIWSYNPFLAIVVAILAYLVYLESHKTSAGHVHYIHHIRIS